MTDPKKLPAVLQAEAPRCRHVVTPPQGRFVTSGVITRRLVAAGIVDAYEGDDGRWYGTSRVGKTLQITDPMSTQAEALLAAKFFGRFEVETPAPVALVFPPVQTKEVWLLDTGRFLVLDDLHPAWRNSVGFMMRMRQRRKMVFFVPIDEISKLGNLETMGQIAKRGFEVRGTLAGVEKWRSERDRLRNRLRESSPNPEDPATNPKAYKADLDAYDDHLANEAKAYANVLRTVDGLTAGFPAEKDAIIGNAAFTPRKVPYPSPEERKKLEAAKNGAPTGKTKKKPA